MTVSTYPRFILATVAILALSTTSAAAFECPKHFAAAEAKINKVKQDMGATMSKNIPKEQMALVHALLDDAKMRLYGANHNHKKPQNAYDHARAIAKADAALGYATAAGMLHAKTMKM